MIVLNNRQGQRAVVAIGRGYEATAPFHPRPSVIFPTRTCRRLKINLLKPVLAHISDKQIPRFPVEAESPGVAQAIGPDFRPGAAYTDKRVVGGDSVRQTTIYIDPQDFTEKLA